MTDTSTDVDLGEFDGRDVLTTSVKVTRAGDGLSEALGVDPQLLHHGDRGAIVIEYEVDKITFDPIKDTAGLNRVHTLKAMRGTLISLDEVQEKLDEQTRRIEEAEGVLQLDLDGEGGEPQAVGEVLDGALDLAEDAEDVATWRAEREDELTKWKKDALSEHLVSLGCEDPGDMTKPELVAEIIEWEEADRG